MANDTTPINGTPVSATPTGVSVGSTDTGVPNASGTSGSFDDGNSGFGNSTSGNFDDGNTGFGNGTPVDQAPATQAQGIGDTGTLSNGDLPWAIVLLPTTSSGVGNAGPGRHQLQVGSWVYGFFADGQDCQQPVIVGVWPGGPGGGTGGEGDSTAGQGTSGTGSSGSGTGSVGGASNNVGKGGNADFVYDKLRSVGFTHVQAVGIMGNLLQESGLRSTGRSGDNGTAHGVAQWRGVRWTHFKEYADSKSPNGKLYGDLGTQLEFIKVEMDRYSSLTGYAWSVLKNARTAEEAAQAFGNFEFYGGCRASGRKPGMMACPVTNGDTANRMKNANGYDKQYRNRGAKTPDSGATSAPQAQASPSIPFDNITTQIPFRQTPTDSVQAGS
jgi:hypothetical protein